MLYRSMTLNQENISHLICTTGPLNLPRKPKHLKLHNLCTNPKSLLKKLETLGLNQGHGMVTSKKQTNPTGFEQLRRTIWLKYVPSPPEHPDNRYNPKLRVASKWEPPEAQLDIKKAIDMFEKTTNEAFCDCQKKTPITNMKKNHQSIGIIEERSQIHHYRCQ